MIFAKILGLIAWFMCGLSWGEGSSFTQNAVLPANTANYSEEQEKVVSQLKQQAIVEWLQAHLNQRYPLFEKLISPDFGDKYILDYKFGRSTTDRNRLEVKGRLDTNALKRWVRQMETKAKGASSKPIFVLSSEIPGMSFSPQESHRAISETPLAQTLFNLASASLQRINIRLESKALSGLNLPPPSRSNQYSQISDLYHSAQAYSVLWIHLTSLGENQVRMDTNFYQVNPPRLAFSKTDELKIAAREYSKVETLKQMFTPVMDALRNELEDLLSSGLLLSSKYRIVVEPIENYKQFKRIESQVTEADFIVQASLRVASAGVAEFEVMSPLGADELATKLSRLGLPGAKARVVP